MTPFVDGPRSGRLLARAQASGTAATSGVISAANSLVGTTSFDHIGGPPPSSAMPVFWLQSNDNFVLTNFQWDNMGLSNAGAVTLGEGSGGTVGALSEHNSALGNLADPLHTHLFVYDPARNQLIVGQPSSNRVVLQRTGIATSVIDVSDTPDPSIVGEAVVFTATVSALPNAPADGQVTFRASSGESCVDATATPLSATTAEYSCAFALSASGSTTIIAEYTGSVIHAFSRSTSEQHTVADAGAIFGNGFEVP
jgi:hypothetical protein